MMKKVQTSLKSIQDRLKNGKIIEQKAWSFIRELNSFSEEQLDKTALISGKRSYTYRQMFRRWDCYAEVFSGLRICEEEHSRAAMLFSADPEAVLIFYGLNITGASASMINPLDLMDKAGLGRIIEKEHITDLIISDLLLNPELIGWLTSEREKLCLRHIIVVHTPLEGEFAPPELQIYSRVNPERILRRPGFLYMADLLRQYEAAPIRYGSALSADDAIILHTSGTTNGIHKPVPLSDRGFNEAAARIMREPRFAPLQGNLISLLGMDLSGSYGAADMMHLPLAFNGTIVTVPLGQFNPRFSDALSHYGCNVLFAATMQMEDWIRDKRPKDFSGLQFISLGGTYISAESRKRYSEFMERYGCTTGICNGYGLSEAGGACIVSTPDRDDDAIGFPLPGVKVKIYNEDEEKYYDIADGPHTGVMFLATPSVSCGRIDDEIFFTTVEIDGDQYLNTYDQVTVNEDGSLTYTGRMNKFFVNNEGIRFDAGLVETAVSAQPGIRSCALAPEYDKLMHDTFPVLYVQTTEDAVPALSTVKTALINVFIRDNRISESNMPGQCILVDDIPYTPTGKVDVHQIMKGAVTGTRYMIKPIWHKEKLADILLTPASSEVLGQWAGVPQELQPNHGKGKPPEEKKPPEAQPEKPFPFSFPFSGGMKPEKTPSFDCLFPFPKGFPFSAPDNVNSDQEAPCKGFPPFPFPEMKKPEQAPREETAKSSEENPDQAQEKQLFPDFLSTLLSRLFNASDYDQFFED